MHKEYRNFKYWLVETKRDGKKIYRIQFPGGHKTPPFEVSGEPDVKAQIDNIIENLAGK